MQSISTLLMFEGQAEEAMNFYIALFEDSYVADLQRYEDSGKVMVASFSLQGQIFKCIDSTVKHGFTFTPAMSIYVEFESTEQLDHIYSQLMAEGTVLMPLDSYFFSTRFAWITDKYGVSWQLNFAKD